jgi:hypothetical protein
VEPIGGERLVARAEFGLRFLCDLGNLPDDTVVWKESQKQVIRSRRRPGNARQVKLFAHGHQLMAREYLKARRILHAIHRIIYSIIT